MEIGIALSSEDHGPRELVRQAQMAAEHVRVLHRSRRGPAPGAPVVAEMGLPGGLAQILPTPAHFEQAAELVGPDIGDSIPTGPDAKAYVASIHEYADAGYDEPYIHNIGPHHEAFFRFFAAEVRPHL
jgi:hypothetical protein